MQCHIVEAFLRYPEEQGDYLHVAYSQVSLSAALGGGPNLTLGPSELLGVELLSFCIRSFHRWV